MNSRASVLLLFLIACLVGSEAVAQTGVSDDRVSLPEGPGSLEGVGENVGMSLNMGTMSWSMPIEAPGGFSGLTPDLALAYNSSLGSSVVGIGWMMEIPFIERMTWRGLPEYDVDDDFNAGDGEQLVRVVNGANAVYRARYEEGFVRYTWMNRGAGAEGYWLAEYPDGSKAWFGADATGTLVSDARVTGPDGTFRYMIVEKQDVFGHRLRYGYVKDGFVSLVSQIGWVYNDPANPNSPRYSLSFTYELRRDATGEAWLSDARGGFDERLTQRLASVDVFSGVERIRRYELSYERYDTAGGFTRLTRIVKKGLEGGTYPAVFQFTYSRALGGLCNGQDCQRPYLVGMGSLGINLGSGNATLIDINGDALPDVLHTHPQSGQHTFFLNVPDAEGGSHFQTPGIPSAVDGGNFVLGTPTAQVLDTNGDGFTDMLDARNHRVLINDGSGDWMDTSLIEGEVPDLGLDDVDGDGLLNTLRFVDYDNDKKIDIMRSTRTETRFYRNLGGGYALDDAVDNLGWGFQEDDIDLTDMNGDGLLDAVKLRPGQVEYRLNLGWGRWSDNRFIDDVAFLTVSTIPLASLEDLNGDALADLVLVTGNRVEYALNRNGQNFFATQTIESTGVDGGDIPERTQGVSVLYADMNGNGSNDIVWIDAAGNTTYLELFPVRPNLLSRIENGLGKVTDITYGTSVEHMARDGGTGAWRHKLPHPMIVVDAIDEYDLLTNIHDVNRYTYHDGFYDGVEKQFRGYARIEQLMVGDETQEEGLSETVFDVGATDPWYHGKALSTRTSSAGRLLSDQVMRYEDCPVAEIPTAAQLAQDGQNPIRHVCMTEETTVEQEGTAPARHATLRSTQQHDGYGNVTLAVSHGVTAIGGGACAPCDRDPAIFGAPCGAQCLGDESYEETEYITPGTNTGGRWIIHAPMRERMYGRPNPSVYKETLTTYDGPAFVGLPLGQLTEGRVSRVTLKVDPTSDRVIATQRSRYDEHGNVVESLDPLGQPGGTTHRRTFAYDEEHLRVTQTELYLESPEGDPYTLRRVTRYEDLFDKLAENTEWVRVVDGQERSTRRSTFLTYDEFGRQSSHVLPGGDTVPSPTETYTYDLASPVSRIIVQRRSQVGGPLDIETIRCLDGRGRRVQDRTRLDAGRYQVTGLSFYNVKNKPETVYQPFVAEGAGADRCSTATPDGVLATHYRYDAIDRAIEVIAPDAALYGEPSVSRTAFEPLATLAFDDEDTDPNSPHANTPTVERRDGLGRVVAIDRYLTPTTFETTEVRYDELGRMRGYVDADGHEKIQRYDLLDRLLARTDPNTGADATYTWDDASNLLSATDARGVTTEATYDGLNRPVARWDTADRDGTLLQWRYDHAPACSASLCTNTEARIVETSWPGFDGERASDRAGYDARGRTIASSRHLEGFDFEVTMTYDNANRLLTTTWPDGQVVANHYDDANRLTAIDGLVTAIAWDERALLGSVRYGDGTTDARTWDDRMRLASMTTSHGANVLQAFLYDRDRTGNLLQIEDGAAPAPDRPRFDALFDYDAWYRLTTADLGPESARESLTYAFDAIDNLTRATSSDTASRSHHGELAYDGAGPNAVSQVGDVAYAYDAGGYLSSRGDLDLAWDFMGRLTEVRRDGLPVATFAYGANQSRVTRVEDGSVTHYVGRDFEIRDGITTLYVRVGRDRVARIERADLATTLLSDLDGDDQITAADAWQADQSGEGSPVERLLWSAARRHLLENGPDTVFLHHDHLGSATLATDGDALGHRSFDPLGEIRQSFGYVDAYGFTGQERDASTGLLHFDWRYYDPSAGRWISIDPAFATASAGNIGRLGESTTAYAYVSGNFANAFDPTGLGKNGLIVRFNSWRARRAAGSNYSSRSANSSDYANSIRTNQSTRSDYSVRANHSIRSKHSYRSSLSSRRSSARSSTDFGHDDFISKINELSNPAPDRDAWNPLQNSSQYDSASKLGWMIRNHDGLYTSPHQSQRMPGHSAATSNDSDHHQTSLIESKEYFHKSTSIFNPNHTSPNRLEYQYTPKSISNE